ncbi:MAG: 2-oxo-4-hydroxy-4-carboxy-5-ureidoimidazoline decarboxylase [Xanthomonadales bacterium]|nr:2-oxo-4-hydroxy-4-carboxy-5-ureidoimidazoline decarboxylase [Xanthomonadales bacterium]
MRNANPRLQPPPSHATEAEFVSRFAGVYEHSAWVAHAAWADGIHSEHDTVHGLAQLLAAQVNSADAATKLALICAHPDLGGRAARTGTLSTDSAREQASAGLDACTEAEFARLQTLNTAYRDKFGFPFIIAVKGMQRSDILTAMESRLANDPATERDRALDEIHKIARLRLAAMT